MTWEHDVALPKRQLRVMHLFAGAGGGILADLLTGHDPVCAVEIDDYCRKVLLARQRDGMLPRFPIWDDIIAFDGVPWRGRVDIVAGGFPCQDISAAGTGEGLKGSRSGLWFEMARVIGEVRPTYVFVENSPVLVVRGLDRVLGDLTEMGYDARWGVVGADDAGAPHRRKRIWIVADASGTDARGGASKQQSPESIDGKSTQLLPDPSRRSGQTKTGHNNQTPMADSDSRRRLENPGNRELRTEGAEQSPIHPGGTDERETQKGSQGREWWQTDPADIPDSDEWGLQDGPDREWEVRSESNAVKRTCAPEQGENREMWPVESRVGRVAHGMACRVDRLKAIGNGQVPAVAALAWEMLNDVG